MRLDRDRSSFEGLIGVELATDKVAGIELTPKVSVFPTIGSSRRYRLTFDTNARVPLSRLFHWGVLVYDRYDSDPQPGVTNNDVGIVGTLGLSF